MSLFVRMLVSQGELGLASPSESLTKRRHLQRTAGRGEPQLAFVYWCRHV
jgi:hypothetical protein